MRIRKLMCSRKMKMTVLLPILLAFALSELGTLNLNTLKVSAVVSPYIGVVPESSVDPAITPGMNYTVSIYTDYDGDDVWGYEFKLTFNPNVLQCIEVVNGDLITEDVGPIQFTPGTINNTSGELDMTFNGFMRIPGSDPTFTSGPGTLANVTFRVVSRGNSDITLETELSDPERTKLLGYWYDSDSGIWVLFNIIDSGETPDQIQHGIFDNRFTHDVAVVSVTAHAETAVGSVSISVEVENIGKSDEDVEVAVSYDSTPIDSQNVMVDEGASETVLFSWNTAGLAQGMYAVNATATIPDDGDLSDNWNTTTFLVAHDVAVVSVTALDKVTLGSLVSISVEVANEGSLTEAANVTIRHDSTLIDFNDTVVLPAQDSTTVPFNWNTTGLTEGTYTINATATIPDDGDPSDNWNTTTILLSGHDVAVVSVTAPAKAAVGSSVSISVEVKNIGIYDEDVEVAVSFDSTPIDSQNVMVTKGASETVSFSWNTAGLTEDMYTINATATIPDDGDPSDNWNTTTIPILEHDVTVKDILLTPATATPGDIVYINVTVSNIGASPEVANVTIRRGSILIGFNDTVELDEGASETVSFSWNTAGLAQGMYTINATATIPEEWDLSDNWNTTTILLAKHDVAVTHISVSPPMIYVGDLTTIKVQVRNHGWYNETKFEVKVTYDTSIIEEPKSVALLSGDAEYTEFSWNTTGVAPGSYTITANASLVTDQDLANNLLTKPIVVNPPLPAIAGTVMDASNGYPLAGASVTADSYTNTTNVDGYYTITGVPIGTFNVTAEATGYYSATKSGIVVESRVTTTVNFTLSLVVGWIEGYVTDIETGAKLVGATVAADGVSTTTDAVGYYKIEHVPGDNTITVSASGYVNKSKTATVIAEEIITVNFALAVPGVVGEEITEPELVNATNPFVVNATEEAATYLLIYEISDPITIIVKNETDPIGDDPPPGTWMVLGNYVQITVNDTDITLNATIRIYYTLEQLETLGLDESTLKIHYWNATSGEWVAVESHVDTEEHFVWTNIGHFSLWALMGQPPLSTPLWLLVPVVIGVVVIAAAVIVIYTRRRKATITQGESEPRKRT